MTLWRVLAEFNKICLQTALGFIVMGFIGFFVKLVFIVSYTPALFLRDLLTRLGDWTVQTLPFDGFHENFVTLIDKGCGVVQPINQIIVGGSAGS